MQDIRTILADIKNGGVKKIILDTDTYNEIDDQFAVAWAVLSDKIDLLSINAAPMKHTGKNQYVVEAIRDLSDDINFSHQQKLSSLGFLSPGSYL